MLTYILTRFSIFDKDSTGLQISNKYNLKNESDQEKYKNELFSPDRLNYKFKVFELVTLPGVVNQTNQNFEWYIYSSVYMPKYYQNKLIELTKPYNNIFVKFISSFKEFFYTIDYTKNNTIDKFCTMRLDDDDGLSPNFIKLINNYKNEKDGTVISFSDGTQISLINNKIEYGISIRYDLIAIGLTVINKDIYSLGDHSLLSERGYTVKLDRTPNMYLICCSEQFCDTKREFIKKTQLSNKIKGVLKNKSKTPLEQLKNK